jgi:hypothetical protein
MLRQLITGKVRSNHGCYTCRLRRKKCDEARPACAGCQALEITCYTGDDKPDWMDGGPRQKEMAEKIKAQVKKQASQRRDRKYLEMLETGAKMVTLGPDEPQAQPDASNTATNNNNTASNTVLTPPSSNTSGNSPPDIPWHTQAFLSQTLQAGSQEGPDVDLHFIMIYLDYVFPYLFPQYRPSMLVGGRGWVLDVVQSNKAVYHTVISLASYFFSIVLAGGRDKHETCLDRVMGRLEVQMEMGLRELQKEMRSLTAQNARVDEREGLLVMQSIVQMLIFEVTTSNKENWKMHLDAAIAIYLQILPRPEYWSEVLAALFSDRFPPAAMTDGFHRPWSTNQAALRFFSAMLFHIDIMACLTLGTSPRLFRFQASIIPGCQEMEETDTFQSARPLAMEEFTGLYNFVTQMVGDVASLHSWKTVQIKAGALSPHELFSRGKILEDALGAASQALEQQIEVFKQQGIVNGIPLLVDDILSPLNALPPTKSPSYVFHNWTWMQTTKIHLRLVMYGWQPSEPTTRAMVVRLTDTLCSLPSAACLRSLAWPFCLAGCLALPEDEAKFRSMADNLGLLRIFGTFKEALRIMETMWARRDQIDETWDVTQCLNILGHGVLLI